MPILAAPMTGSTYNFGAPMSEAEFIEAIVDGCLRAGTVGLTGDGADPACSTAACPPCPATAGAAGHRQAPDQAAVLDRLARAEAAGAAFTGMDIDGAGLVTMALKGQPVGPKTRDELAAIITATRLPFLVKGVMTVEDAEAAIDAGAAGIVVSNHGGRILDHTPGAAEVLPEIAALARGRTAILADGGVRTGGDALKLLALGADAVLVGRPLIVGAVGGGGRGRGAAFEPDARRTRGGHDPDRHGRRGGRGPGHRAPVGSLRRPGGKPFEKGFPPGHPLRKLRRASRPNSLPQPRGVIPIEPCFPPRPGSGALRQSRGAAETGGPGGMIPPGRGPGRQPRPARPGPGHRFSMRL